MSINSSNEVVPSEPELYRHIKFYLFIVLQIPSVLISMFIIYKFVTVRQFRVRLNNHSIFALVIVSFIETTTELPITLDYLRFGYVKIMKYSFCLFWTWFNFSLQTINLILMAWTSFERHILIFHSNLVQTKLGQFKWHYIPLIFCVTYIPIFYFSCVILYQCENFFDYSYIFCGSICYNRVIWLSTFDWTTNVLIPSMIIPLLSLSLLIRVIFQAKKMKRTTNWKSHRKMTIQLTVISILYLAFWFPLAFLVSLIRIYFLPTFIEEITYYYLYYTPYLVQLLMPYVCIACLPEIWPKKNQINVNTTLIH
ncbi:unnamed protein product [Adineta ricciae]|uniref:G-protein coupled receptors family 1 profile domain-containing protein n=1 Tax=Adineta ricciae TaxID=249248 RepID=A0A815QK09_ADIRI|nr:unnamed protein product [Adineta ricciae]CAF1464320.1 unnamed protein product [Adineta ricciae]